MTIGKSTHDKLEHARELLSHALPGGDLAEVLDRALDVLIAQLEKRKCGATSKPRAPKAGASANPRYIPQHVKRAAWQRVSGQCTFVSDTGRRYGMRKFLEFDHAQPVALGGRATGENLRLRCRAHNQLQAERVLGRDFMERRRAFGPAACVGTYDGA